MVEMEGSLWVFLVFIVIMILVGITVFALKVFVAAKIWKKVN